MPQETKIDNFDISRYLKVVSTAENQPANNLQIEVIFKPEDELHVQRLIHDYQAAIRVFRFLAEKDLKGLTRDDPIFEKKQASILKHQSALESVQQILNFIFKNH